MQDTETRYPDVVPDQERRKAIRDEADVVGTWLARAGVLAILIGAGFAFKYGVDRGVIGPSLRVAIGLFAGGAFIAWGEVARRKQWDRFAQALTAGGLSLAYLSVLAAAQLYQLIPGPGAFAALVSITIAGVALAFVHDSPALAAFSLVGAFLNPFLVSTQQQPQPLVTFYYLVAVDLVVVAGAFRRWRALNLLAFAGTVIVFGVAQQNAEPAVAGLFAAILFAIFTAYPFIASKPARPDDVTVAVLAAFAFIPYVEHEMSMLHPGREGLITFALAGMYALLAAGARELRRGDPILSRALFSLAAGAAIVAVPLQLEGPALPAVWAVEAAVLIALGWKTRYDEGLLGGAVLLQAATVMSFAKLGDYHPAKLFISGDGGAFIAVIAALFATAFVLRASHERGYRDAAMLPAWAGTILALSWLSAEAVAYAQLHATPRMRDQTVQLALSLVWAGFGAIALLTGVRARLRAARMFGVALLGLVVVKLLVNDVWLLTTGARMIVFTATGALLIGCSFAYQKLRDLLTDAPEQETKVA